MSDASGVLAVVIGKVASELLAEAVAELGVPKSADGLATLDEVRLRLAVLESVSGELADLLEGAEKDGEL